MLPYVVLVIQIDNINLIYNQKTVPDQWMVSKLVPIHKKGQKNKI